MKKSPESTAYHEAGHALASWHFDLRINKVTIVPGEGTLGCTTGKSAIGRMKPDMDNSNRARLRVEKDVIMLLAGPIAQKKFSPRGWRTYHGQEDFHKTSDILSYFVDDERELNAYFRWLQVRAENLVRNRSNWACIGEIAKKLLVSRTLKGEEIEKLIFRKMQSYR